MLRSETATERSAETIRVKLQALIRSLDAGAGRDEDGCEQVLMDVDIDGQRYLLIRMHVVERKATSLSPREVEIARLVAAGHPNKVIAAVLEISSWTVCTHMRRVFAKLGVTSRAAMVARLVEFSGRMEMTLVPPSERRRTSDEPNDMGLPRPANAYPLPRNQGVAARLVQTPRPNPAGGKVSRNVA